MDPLTQGLLGATLAQTAAQKRYIRKAALCGFIGGLAPDLDVLIRSDVDPLLFIEYHRHFTHSLAFIPIGGLLVSLLLFVIFKKHLSFGRIYLFTTLGFATHGLLDACTSYGTRLFWPFLDYRVGWNIISIIDPLFTLPLLAFVLLSLLYRSPLLIRVGFGIALAYLALGALQHHRVASHIHTLAKERGHTIKRLLLNPTIGNNILWRSVYQTDKHYYIDAVYIPLLGPPLTHKGSSVAVIDKNTIFPELGTNSTQRKDIHRFAYFSQDYIYQHHSDPTILADLRYGTLPYDTYSLWGIKIDTQHPKRHVKHLNLRHFKDKHYDALWLMLNGEKPSIALEPEQ